MKFKTVALLHPGNMGVTIGAAAATSGARVIWASHQRSEATQERARQVGLVDVGNLTNAIRAGTTRLYLSGGRAPEVAELFSASLLDARTIGEKPGSASALKMAYAAWTKCTDALVLAIRALAAMEGVDKALLEEWALSQPQLERRSIQAAGVAAPKAWRYVGEMREIVATFEVAGLPAGFHNAAADLYERLASFKDVTAPPPTVTAVVDALRASSEKHGKVKVADGI